MRKLTVFDNFLHIQMMNSTVEYFDMHFLVLLVSAICYTSTVIYHDTERII